MRITHPAPSNQPLRLRTLAYASTFFFVACSSPAPETYLAASQEPAGEAPEALRIVATLPPLAAVARQVVDARDEVSVLLPAGREPHTYEPAPGALQELRRADLLFRVGHESFPLEARLLQILEGDLDGPRSLSLAEAAARGGRASQADPHPWLSPPVLADAAQALALSLARLRPDRAAAFADRAQAFGERMARLDEEIQTRLGRGECRTFLVDHPAWTAFATRYGLRQLALEADGKPQGPASLRAILNEAREAGLRRFFVEPGVAPARTALAGELGATVEILDPLAEDLPAELLRAADLIAGGCGDG